MNREMHQKVMYTIAAIWNWVLAILFLVLPRIDIGYFGISGNIVPPTFLWFDCFMGLVFAFGIGFYLVSLNPEKNRDLLLIAIFEKCWVFVIGLYYFITGEASAWVLAVVTGDLLFGLLFAEDVLAMRRASPT
jgi:hypothetical protein